MPIPSKKKRRSRKAHACKKYLQRKKNHWIDELETWDNLCGGVKNPNGRSRTFDEEQGQAAGRGKPRVANAQELKVAFVTYLKENKPDKLECKVEKVLQDRGHLVLWTPPYCPELQPIELFWAVAKNHAALQYINGRTMKDLVKHLREGWYGNKWDVPDGDSNLKEPVDCQKLFNEAVKAAETKFIPLCGGISGKIGSLVVDETYEDEEVDIPIDALVLDLTKEGDGDDENGDGDEAMAED